MVYYANDVLGALANLRTTEPVTSPPPPYSPRRGDTQSSQDTSPSENETPRTEFTRNNTPISAATTVSQDSSAIQYGSLSPYPPSTILQGSSPIVTSPVAFPPPPPSTSNPRAHSSSRNHADRLLSSLASRNKNPSARSPVTSVDAYQPYNTLTPVRTSESTLTDSSIRPPASRRAASTGAIGIGGSLPHSAVQSPAADSWGPGMPLPPPPPGPPPANARSQSLSRVPDADALFNGAPTSSRSRQIPSHGTSLGAIPPTPADWREESPASQEQWLSQSTGPTPLHIDTGSVVRRSLTEDQSTSSSGPMESSRSSHHRRDSSNGNLFRSPAIRNRSAKGIRERRSESKNGKGRVFEEQSPRVSSNSSPWAEALNDVTPGDLVLPTAEGNLSRRRAVTKSSPRSGKSFRGLEEIMHSNGAERPHDQDHSIDSSRSTPRPDSARNNQFPKGSTPTPPFSPQRGSFAKPSPRSQTISVLPPKALPTPPPQQSNDQYEQSSLLIPLANDERPISHLLHMPNNDIPIEVLPLSPENSQAIDFLRPESPRAFARRAAERHRVFNEREAAAENDSDRLDLFVQYMIAESRIRRERYASTFTDEEIDVAELIQGMFEAPPTQKNKDSRRQSSQTVEISRHNMRDLSVTPIQDTPRQNTPASGIQNPTLKLDTVNLPPSQSRPESAWYKDFVPVLSPIASLSAATGRDEMESRGRTPSRWWESTSGGSNIGDAFKVLERTKRESKYMGLTREARTSPLVFESGVSVQIDGADEQLSRPLGPNGYPIDEKTGWHEPSDVPPPPPPPPHPPTPQSAPFTPDSRKLDISRLYLLPPPFPRHFPAADNNHPDLLEMRSLVRGLYDQSEADATKESYRVSMAEKKRRADSWCKHQRSLHSQDLQFRLEHGDMSQEDFDQAEADIEAKEFQSAKGLTQTSFDLFQSEVVSSVHALLSSRITSASNNLEALSNRLFSDTTSPSPNLPQEEGDEQPELLEKLTLLKWLFEARESCERAIFNLLSERNDLYRAVVLLPYQHSRNHDKIAEAEAFFAKDALERRIAFDKSVFARATAFLDVIEPNVVRGVEVQLSAFWDIAPSLLDLLQRIPTNTTNLDTFDIHIPPAEIDENPSYWNFPLQYLYSLVLHAERSSRRFIDNQVGLLCLLHEVRGYVGVARCTVCGEGERERRAAEERLTDDLKEKVGELEAQWGQGLGGCAGGVREKVREWLVERGGWDEGLDGEVGA